MEDHVGPVPRQHVDRALSASDVGEHRHGVATVVVTQSRRQLDERCLGVVDEDEGADAQPRQPGSKFGAEGASSAGNENGCVGDVMREVTISDVDGRSTEKRFEGGVSVRFACDSDYVTPFCGNVQPLCNARARASTTRS